MICCLDPSSMRATLFMEFNSFDSYDRFRSACEDVPNIQGGIRKRRGAYGGPPLSRLTMRSLSSSNQAESDRSFVHPRLFSICRWKSSRSTLGVPVLLLNLLLTTKMNLIMVETTI